MKGLATTSANVPTIELSQRRPRDSCTTKLPLLCLVRRPQGNHHQGMYSGRTMQWTSLGLHLTLHGLKPTPAAVDGVVLGPTPTTTILVEGTPAEALPDTRSPVTIVSMDFWVKALTCRKEHCDNQTIVKR